MAGGRVDEYNDFGTAISPRAALVFPNGFGGRFKVMYGEAFKAPSFFQMYLQNQPFFIGNPDLEAEKVRTHEITWVQPLSITELTTTFFHNRIEDKQRVVRDVVTYANEGVESYEGFEFEAKMAIRNRYYFRASYSVLTAGDTEMAEQHGSVNLNASFGRLNVNVSDIYRSEINVLEDSGWENQINAKIQYELTDHFEVYVRGINLLNSDIESPAIGLSGDIATFGPMPHRGRELFAGLTYTW